MTAIENVLGTMCEVSDELVKEEVAPCFDLDSAGNNCVHRQMFDEGLDAKKEARRMRCDLMSMDGDLLCLSCRAYWQCEKLRDTLRQIHWRIHCVR